jgi:hypothetical protein
MGLGWIGMIIESQIRFWLARVLANEVSLDCFEDWFVQQSWNMHQDSDPSAQKLVAAIELRLAEYSSGHLSSAELCEELRSFASIYVNPAARTTSAENVSSLTGKAAVPYSIAQVAQSADRLFATGYEYIFGH